MPVLIKCADVSLESHDMVGVPVNGKGVKIIGWIKPEGESLLLLPLALGEGINMKRARKSLARSKHRWSGEHIGTEDAMVTNAGWPKS